MREQERLKIYQPKLLIVEGKDEENIFRYWLKKLGLSDVQVMPIGGKTMLNGNLQLLKSQTNYNYVSHIAIIRDADTNKDGAFQSVCSSIRALDIIPPSDQIIFSNTNPKVKILITCNNEGKGSIENYFYDSVKDKNKFSCIEKFFDCLEENNNRFGSSEKKIIAKVYAYLASDSSTLRLRLGDSVLAGHWDLEHSSFNIIRKFISEW